MTEHQFTSDDYYTPQTVFDVLQTQFDLDPAHPPFKTNVPCNKYYTIDDDGLSKKWFGNVWLNPPFSKPKPWVIKFIEHANGIALLPQSKAQWFYDLWQTDVAITTFNAKLKFADPRGGRGSIMMPTCLVAIGKQNIEAIARIGKVR